MLSNAMAPGQLSDRSAWCRLAPLLHIEGCAVSPAEIQLDQYKLDEQARRMASEGYFEIDQIDWKYPLDNLADLISRLSEQRIPTVFAFVYDEFWAPFIQLGPVLREVLDGDYRRLPDFWAWRVDPRTGESGWDLHRDRGVESLFADGRPKAVSVWIGLTDASPLNGCLYLVPADRDPGYGKSGSISEFNLQDARAIPSSAGTAIVWNTHILHWGSRASPRASEPRISIGMVFQSSAAPAIEVPLTNPSEGVPFEMRLRLIERQIGKFEGWYSGARKAELDLWGKALRNHLGAAPEEGPSRAPVGNLLSRILARARR